ncbi:hypothetical protein Ccrd_010027 [Cynara cardunculus var. scolymus]|uniref:Uncharacterized protein n=1 Tax=Cynara cardunculus var. scolymus TaxID=59895 RepID=A0A103XQQ1_CYNCS|nr:hypothetical protein Ccrd_002779 [Cynara cardunculus var. scolymus]KVI11559.1 hypothetical protein Ccrd_010027 [Cynara cardunculus var. scolymus]
MASTVEFHPQCDKKPPVDGWLRISSCGAHPWPDAPDRKLGLFSEVLMSKATEPSTSSSQRGFWPGVGGPRPLNPLGGPVFPSAGRQAGNHSDLTWLHVSYLCLPLPVIHGGCDCAGSEERHHRDLVIYENLLAPAHHDVNHNTRGSDSGSCGQERLDSFTHLYVLIVKRVPHRSWWRNLLFSRSGFVGRLRWRRDGDFDDMNKRGVVGKGGGYR